MYLQDISVISVITDVSVISVIGQGLKSFHKPFNALIKNQIEPLLINNSVSAENVSLVILKSQLNKALNILHGEIFGMSKKVNLAIFGHGNVGSALIDQLLDSANTIEKRKAIKLNVFAIAKSLN